MKKENLEELPGLRDTVPKEELPRLIYVLSDNSVCLGVNKDSIEGTIQGTGLAPNFLLIVEIVSNYQANIEITVSRNFLWIIDNDLKLKIREATERTISNLNRIFYTGETTPEEAYRTIGRGLQKMGFKRKIEHISYTYE